MNGIVRGNVVVSTLRVGSARSSDEGDGEPDEPGAPEHVATEAAGWKQILNALTIHYGDRLAPTS